MKAIYLIIGLAVCGPALNAAYNYGEYDITDTYVSSATMLVRVDRDGEIKEIWSGMDAKRMRASPLCLLTSVFGEITRAGVWTDLRKLKYHAVGTRPGFIHMQSDDGLVGIEIAARHDAGPSPIFVTYRFSTPVDFRLSADFRHPEFVQEAHADDSKGSATFSTRWAGQRDYTVGLDGGPSLVLATQPLGSTLSIDRKGFVRQIDAAREVTLCIDATDRMKPTDGESYVEAWRRLLGPSRTGWAGSPSDRVSIESDDKKLDRLVDCSIDAVEDLQFDSGVMIVDFGKYKGAWMRDGSYAMLGLALAGNDQAVDRFFAYWDAQRGFSVGGEVEAQQPAIAITAMGYFARLNPNGQALLQKRWSFVKYYSDYYMRRIAKEGMLNVGEEWITNIPVPSSWPNAEIYSGLRAAAKIAGILGHVQESQEWNRAADRLKERFSTQAYDQAKARIIPMAGPAGQSYVDPKNPTNPRNGQPMRDDRVDGGMLNTASLEVFGKNQGIVAVDDPKFASTQAQIIRDLELPDHSLWGFGPNPENPHSTRGLRTPTGRRTIMPFVTEFAIHDEWLLGHTDLAWRYLLSGIVNKQGYDLVGMNYSIPEGWDDRGVPGDPMYAWTHGEVITSTLLLFLGLDLEPEHADLGLAPSLPPGMNHAKIINFHFRSWRLNVDLARVPDGVDVKVKAADLKVTGVPLVMRIPSGKIITLKTGDEARFTVDPAQYYQAFGRSRNAVERASIFSTILAGKEPATDLEKMSPAEQERFIAGVEMKCAGLWSKP